jgi:hypothetical protein
MSHQHILQWFPGLDPITLLVTSPRTPTYNCIAYAAGDHGRWWWPDPDGLFYWPVSIQRVERLAAFQAAFESLGYELTGDSDLLNEFEKIAIFSKNGTPTHAARQLEDGTWSSKLGQSEDVSHGLSGIEGDHYGSVAFFMQRRRIRA